MLFCQQEYYMCFLKHIKFWQKISFNLDKLLAIRCWEVQNRLTVAPFALGILVASWMWGNSHQTLASDMVLERAIGQMFKCTSVKVDGVCSSVLVGHYEPWRRQFFRRIAKNPHTISLVQFPVTRSYFSPYFQAVRVQSDSGLGFFLSAESTRMSRQRMP